MTPEEFPRWCTRCSRRVISTQHSRRGRLLDAIVWGPASLFVLASAQAEVDVTRDHAISNAESAGELLPGRRKLHVVAWGEIVGTCERRPRITRCSEPKASGSRLHVVGHRSSRLRASHARDREQRVHLGAMLFGERERLVEEVRLRRAQRLTVIDDA
jgi:hypothetical protein